MKARLGSAYWWFWGSSALDNIADGILAIALPLLALRLTRSPPLIAGILAANRLPWLIFALLSGAVADRADRRRLMISVQVLRTLLIAGLTVLVASGHPTLWLVYVVAFGLGTGETLYDAAALTVVPVLVRDDNLERANGRLSGVQLAANVCVGLPLGGLLAGISIVLALGQSTIAYLAAASSLFGLRGRFRFSQSRPRRSLRSDIGEGLIHLWQHKVLRRLAFVTAGFHLSMAAAFALLPIYAVAPGPMRLSAFGYGLLITFIGVGGGVASLVSGWLRRRLGGRGALLASTVVIALTIGSPLLKMPIAVAAFMLVHGFGRVVWSITVVSLRQRSIPQYVLGRVNSVYLLVQYGGAMVGAVVGGVVAGFVGIPATFLGTSVAVLVLALFIRATKDGDFQTVGHRIVDSAVRQESVSIVHSGRNANV
jgi:MFS family permease